MHRLAAAIGLVVASAALGGVAASQSGSGDQYTGCLTAGGAIVKAAVGNEPLSPCATGQSEISWNQTGPPGPPGPATLSSVYTTDRDTVRFEPGDPAMDFMRLDLPAGNYMFYVTSGAFPEALFDSEGNPAGFAQGGAVECRFFEEADDGTRIDLTGVKHGAVGMAAAGSHDFIPAIQPESTYIHPHPDHPEGAAVVLVCEHYFNELIDVHASWSAVAAGDMDFQPSVPSTDQ